MSETDHGTNRAEAPPEGTRAVVLLYDEITVAMPRREAEANGYDYNEPGPWRDAFTRAPEDPGDETVSAVFTAGDVLPPEIVGSVWASFQDRLAALGPPPLYERLDAESNAENRVFRQSADEAVTGARRRLVEQAADEDAETEAETEG